MSAVDARLATAPVAVERGGSAVSWPAIFVGAAGAAAIGLVLVVLGFGLGLSAISPWEGTGATGKTLTIAAVAWLAFSQIAASSLGGYLAGRLRVKWPGLHTDEVYFRDTAHGFMAWAVASLGTVVLLGAGVASMLGSATGAGAHLAAHAGSSYEVSADRLLRNDDASATPASAEVRNAVVRTLANGIHDGSLADADKQYLANVVAKNAGISVDDARQRVDQRFTEARNAIDTARKAAAYSSLWLFVSLMLGAFFASLAATLGGKRRDDMI